MIAMENLLVVAKPVAEAKAFVKGYEEGGLEVSTFTSDDKKLVLVVATGSATDVALATEFVPPVETKEVKPAAGGKA